MQTKLKRRTKAITFCAMFTALTAVTSQLSIPIPPVPLNLALLTVFLSAGLLGAKLGTLSQGVFIALGAVGVPVFAGFRGGIAALVGPTGGFIFAYLVVAIYVGILSHFCKNKWYFLFLVMASSLLLVYTFGSMWYMIYAKVTFSKALTACVIPFIAGDLIKAVLAAILTSRLSPLFRDIYAKTPRNSPVVATEIEAEVASHTENID